MSDEKFQMHEGVFSYGGPSEADSLRQQVASLEADIEAGKFRERELQSSINGCAQRVLALGQQVTSLTEERDRLKAWNERLKAELESCDEALSNSHGVDMPLPGSEPQG